MGAPLDEVPAGKSFRLAAAFNSPRGDRAGDASPTNCSVRSGFQPRTVTFFVTDRFDILADAAVAAATGRRRHHT